MTLKEKIINVNTLERIKHRKKYRKLYRLKNKTLLIYLIIKDEFRKFFVMV